MTLIVGKVVQNHVYIFGDTALSTDNMSKLNHITDGCQARTKNAPLLVKLETNSPT